MKGNIDRIIGEAEYILENKCTVREGATHFGVSKSTFHADVSYKLKEIDLKLYEEVKELLEYHFSVRHLRGGEATRRKYSREKDSETDVRIN